MNLKTKFANFFFQKKKPKPKTQSKKQLIRSENLHAQCTKHNTSDIIFHCMFSKNVKHILHRDQNQVYHSILYHNTCNQFWTPVY